MNVAVSIEGNIETDEVIALYKANGWSSAEKPEIFNCFTAVVCPDVIIISFFLRNVDSCII